MNRILAIVEIDKLIFSYDLNDIKKEDIIRKLIYDKIYLKNNIELTTATINEILKDKNINEVIINNYELIDITLEIIKNVEQIDKLIIKENKILNYDICEKIISINHIKFLECYHVAESMLDDFKDKNIDVFLRSENFSLSNFVSTNRLNTYNDVYLKKLVVFKNKITSNDLKDFQKFCEINEYITEINILGNFKLNDLKFITSSLVKNNLNNVLINIYPESIGLEEVGYIYTDLKKLGKNLKKENGIIINTRFSDNYKKSNYIRQLNFYNFKMAITLIIMIVSFELIYIGYNMYENTKDVNNIQELNPGNVVIIEENIVIEDDEEPIVNSEHEETNNNQDTNIIPTPALTQDFSKLLEINPDTVGWLTVNNTKIDYPVVKSVNNKYYLNKSFYKKNSIAGWIYMDYRNSIDHLDQNTIIYGHSGIKNSTMFTTLNQIMKQSWLNNYSNHIITFNTLNVSMKWQIFSIYVTEPTFDYLRNNYYDDGTRFTNFLNDVKSRSIYNFNVEVNNTDNILTLSTCYEQGTKRLVVHAKLLK